MHRSTRSHRLSRILTLILVLSVVFFNLQSILTTLAWNTLPPTSVVVAGDLQTSIGCGGNWDPACSSTGLTFDNGNQVWTHVFNLAAGAYQYKAALNGGWGENYGANAIPGGGNIGLNLASNSTVKFYYDHKTHWIADNVNTRIVTAPGDFQSELGCSGDWQPECLRSWLEDVSGSGTFTRQITGLPAGSYQVKAAISESWSENYGVGGTPGGANIPFTVGSTSDIVRFSFVSSTNVLTVTVNSATPEPANVTLVGDLQTSMGCGGNWDPSCAVSHMTYNAANDLWQVSSTSIPSGSYNYKVAINNAWTISYGANGVLNGGNISFNKSSGAGSPVDFFFDYNTKWVSLWDESFSTPDYTNPQSFVATVPGDFQSELGCSGDWQPTCLRSMLKGPYSDGNYYLFTNSLPAGTYQAKVAIDEGWTTNFGAGGTPGGANIGFSVPTTGSFVIFRWNPTSKILDILIGGAPAGDLTKRKAFWVAKDLLAWNTAAAGPADTYKLSYSTTASLTLTASGITGGSDITLTYDPAGLPAAVQAQFPYISSYKAYHISPADLANFQTMIRGQFAIEALDSGGKVLDATSLQISGALDDAFNYTGALGVTFSSPPTLRVWAPTAQNVRLMLYNDANPATLPTYYQMAYDSTSGVWSVTGDNTWANKYYLYEITVYAPSTGSIVVNQVTDPYSISLSMNGTRSQIVDLNDPALKPAGWDSVQKPALENFTDIVIYELQVRDFSINDSTVSAANRGTYKAFTELNSNGMKHLAQLAAAGLTHIHILPSFDIASVSEDKSTWQQPNFSGCPAVPTSDQCYQNAVNAVRDQDGFNWGYDPYHYNTPEGSYSTNPSDSTRVLEFREMVQSLNSIGLRVVMDVVYNHTSASGQDPRSVLDRVVPGYYHRLDTSGNQERSSCCENTASEHKMMGKLLVDSVVMWATAYKVDGFRFDLMGHHMVSNLTQLRSALNSLTPAANGVDGSKVYLYGEAWNFGEVQNNARGVNAIQSNIFGLGVGSFNDRERDGVRGGGPFDDVRYQGFATGLYYTPNTAGPAANSSQAELLRRTDWVRVGIAATLRDYQLVDRFGNLVPASGIDYQGQQAGYTANPQEVINYISAHDNETLWDAVQYKAAASADITTRIRYNNLGIATVMLSQGIPFFHAGDDILRSKSMDRNSYNSSDWFNAVDWSMQTNNWAVGVPLQGDNGGNWPIITPLLDNAALRVTPAQISGANAVFRELLAIRKSSRLFRLTSGADIQQRLSFINTGPSQIPGLVVYALDNRTGTSVDPSVRYALVVINSTPNQQTFSDPALAGLELKLHPVLLNSVDPLSRTSSYDPTGSITVPGLTVAVFVNTTGVWNPGVTSLTSTTTGTGPTSLPATGYLPAEPSTSNNGQLPLLIIATLFVGVGLVTMLRRR